MGLPIEHLEGSEAPETFLPAAGNANYPNILFGHDGSSMCFTSHGLGPAYGAKKGKACFYLPLSWF